MGRGKLEKRKRKGERKGEIDIEREKFTQKGERENEERQEHIEGRRETAIGVNGGVGAKKTRNEVLVGITRRGDASIFY